MTIATLPDTLDTALVIENLVRPQAAPATARLTVALGEYDTGWHDPKASLAAASRLIRRVAEVGADVVVLPELATTGATTEGDRAVTLDSPDVAAIRAMAKSNQMWVVAGIALREARGACAVNAAIAVNPKGEIVATHRKRRLFGFAGEDREFTPGDESTIVDIDGVKLGIFICYELRFPELFRPIASEVDAMVVVANWPANRHEHWDALLRARAIENQCFMIGVNRTGFADGLSYLGGSTVFDPWGDRISPTPVHSTRIATIDTDRVRKLRESHPFLKDALSS